MKATGEHTAEEIGRTLGVSRATVYRMLQEALPPRPHRLSNVFAIHDYGRMDDPVTALRAENAELRRLLEKHQWAGLTPFKSNGCCPECSGPAPPRGSGHRPGCAIAAILVLSTPLPYDL
jgi:hypothetical protein